MLCISSQRDIWVGLALCARHFLVLCATPVLPKPHLITSRWFWGLGRWGKCHFGTIWVYHGEHPSLTHSFKYPLFFVFKLNPPKFALGENGNFFARHAARMQTLKKSVLASRPAKCHVGGPAFSCGPQCTLTQGDPWLSMAPAHVPIAACHCTMCTHWWPLPRHPPAASFLAERCLWSFVGH